MKQKMKLTDLRHVETSKEEMNHIKGGEQGQLCVGCTCVCSCSNDKTVSTQNSTSTSRSSRDNGTISWLIDLTPFPGLFPPET